MMKKEPSEEEIAFFNDLYRRLLAIAAAKFLSNDQTFRFHLQTKTGAFCDGARILWMAQQVFGDAP
jgi:hypothetical protein